MDDVTGSDLVGMVLQGICAGAPIMVIIRTDAGSFVVCNYSSMSVYAIEALLAYAEKHNIDDFDACAHAAKDVDSDSIFAHVDRKAVEHLLREVRRNGDGSG